MFIFIPMADRTKTSPRKRMHPTLPDAFDVETSQALKWIAPLFALLSMAEEAAVATTLGVLPVGTFMLDPMILNSLW
jgi:hypothetical protein